MSRQDETNEILTKVESAVRSALQEIQRGRILCVPKSLEQQQLEGAVRIVMRQVARECGELAVGADQSGRDIGGDLKSNNEENSQATKSITDVHPVPHGK